MNRLILVVEDEPKLASLLADYLRASSFEPHCLENGMDVVPWVREHRPGLVLHRPYAPGTGRNGDMRRYQDILHGTHNNGNGPDRGDRPLLGLEIGADDYICKPFSPREVVARVKAVLRRTQGGQTLEASGLTLDEHRWRATLNGRDLGLTAVEFKLLQFLAANPGRIFGRQQLMDRIYPDERVVSERTIDSHIKKLRKKLQTADPKANLIHAVYSVGYKFENA
jgi:two-component system response regulator BaeR